VATDSVNNTLKLLVHGQGYVTESGKYLLQFIILYLKQCKTINCVKIMYLACDD